MLKKLFRVTVALNILLFSSGALAKCEPPCKEGETCRFEQPNTYECRSYENVSGSQGAFQSRSPNNMGNAGLRMPNNTGAKKQAPFKRGVSNGCSNASGPCVSIKAAGREIVTSSVKEAITKALRTRLELGTFGDFRIDANRPALQEFAGGASRNFGPVFDQMLKHRFPEYPSLREIHKLQSMFPPMDQLRGKWMGKEMAAIQAQYGIESLLAAMAEMKDIAIGSGGGILPVVVAGLAAVSADAWLNAAIVVGVAAATYYANQPGDYDDKGDLDKDGIPNDKDRDKDGDGKYDPAYGDEEQDNDDWDPNTIIAETEGRMMLTVGAPYQMMLLTKQFFGAYGNMFYQIRY